MRNIAILILIILTSLPVLGEESIGGPDGMEAPSVAVQNIEIGVQEIKKRSLHDRFVDGILKSRSVKNKRTGKRNPWWYECGRRIPRDERVKRASEWADAIIEAIRIADEEYGTELPPWGVLAVIHNEAGYDVCAVDFPTKHWAVDHGVVRKFHQSYDLDTVYTIVKARAFFGLRTDLGPLQVRRGGKITKDELKEVLSLDPGIVIGTKELARRSVLYPKIVKGKSYPHPRPWKLWPTTNPRSTRGYEYDVRISKVAKWLGAKEDEI